MESMTQLRVKGDQKREVEGELRPHAHMGDLCDGKGYKEHVEGDEVVASDTLPTVEEGERQYPIATQWWSRSRIHTPHCWQCAALAGR